MRPPKKEGERKKERRRGGAGGRGGGERKKKGQKNEFPVVPEEIPSSPVPFPPACGLPRPPTNGPGWHCYDAHGMHMSGIATCSFFLFFSTSLLAHGGRGGGVVGIFFFFFPVSCSERGGLREGVGGGSSLRLYSPLLSSLRLLFFRLCLVQVTLKVVRLVTAVEIPELIQRLDRILKTWTRSDRCSANTRCVYCVSLGTVDKALLSFRVSAVPTSNCYS